MVHGVLHDLQPLAPGLRIGHQPWDQFSGIQIVGVGGGAVGAVLVATAGVGPIIAAVVVPASNKC